MMMHINYRVSVLLVLTPFEAPWMVQIESRQDGKEGCGTGIKEGARGSPHVSVYLQSRNFIV